MAETGKKADTSAATNPPVDPAPDIARRESDAAPATPDESRNASMLVKTVWPHTSFIVENVPEIKAEGTMLTKTQLATAEKAAEASGVAISAEEV